MEKGVGGVLPLNHTWLHQNHFKLIDIWYVYIYCMDREGVGKWGGCPCPNKIKKITWNGEREQNTTWSFFLGSWSEIVFDLVLLIIQVLFIWFNWFCFSLATARSCLVASNLDPRVIGTLNNIIGTFQLYHWDTTII